jgi:hypothetical protein
LLLAVVLVVPTGAVVAVVVIVLPQDLQLPLERVMQ